MGRSWLPEPPDGNRSPTELTIPTTVFLPDSDNEDQDIIQVDDSTFENDGYQLLTENDTQEHLESEENDEGIQEDNQRVSINEIETLGIYDHAINSSNDDTANNSKSINNESRDIAVDFDQVRAAMTHVTLPTSAFPPWAVEVPDSELGAFLQNRITLLQQTNSASSESKP